MSGATIKDIAREVGVSVSTVSRVIHDNPRISKATKEKVRAAMDLLNYHPNALARGLARSVIGNLGLILPNDSETLFQNPFFIEAMRGVGVEAQSKGFKLMFSFSKDAQEEVDFITSYINSRWVDGIILFTALKKDRCISYLKERNFPFVVIGRPGDGGDVPWVDNDNVSAMEQVVEALVRRGSQNPAFLGGPRDMWVTADRLQGFRIGLEKEGYPFDQDLAAFAKDFTEEEGYHQMKALLQRERPDGLAATDDYLAFGAQRALIEAGLDEIPIWGFNNSLKGQFIGQPISTVDIQPDQLGARAASLLIQQVRSEEGQPIDPIVSTRLIHRP